jgi:hypothetical protein
VTVVLRVVELASGGSCREAGRYVVACDVDARDGRGEARFTDDPYHAMTFAAAADALAYWQRISNVKPLRPDGQWNRPLTAYSMEVAPAGESGDLHELTR